MDLTVTCYCGAAFHSDEDFIEHWKKRHLGEVYQRPIRKLVQRRMRCTACPFFELTGQVKFRTGSRTWFRPVGKCKKQGGLEILYADKLIYCDLVKEGEEEQMTDT